MRDDGTTGGTKPANPMLAFGRGEEGRICDECFEYDRYDCVCRKRFPFGTPRRRLRRQHAEGEICRFFREAEPDS